MARGVLRMAVTVAALAASPTGLRAEEPAVDDAPHRTTTAVAAFPTVPEAQLQEARPAPPPDETLELLSRDPYASVLMAIRIHENLYGEDPLEDNPYADALRFANPYEDTLRFENPYAEQPLLENPYERRARR